MTENDIMYLGELNMKKDDPKYNSKRLEGWRKGAKVKHISFYLSEEYDKDVLEFLDSKENKRQYIISLIRKDMEN